MNSFKAHLRKSQLTFFFLSPKLASFLPKVQEKFAKELTGAYTSGGACGLIRNNAP